MNWIVFLKERLPLPVYALLVGGICFSGVRITQVLLNTPVNPEVNALNVGLGVAAVFLFFAELRLMDEVKDYRKDLVAHPGRPLPRGVLSVEQVKGAINLVYAAMCVLAGVMLARNVAAGLSDLVVVIYLWLMYKEFYVGDALAKSPFLYACTHQIILIPLCSVAVCAAHPELALSQPNLWYGLTVTGAFFTYEICRKLDPNAHPALGTYLKTYGAGKTILLALLTSALALWAARNLGVLSVTAVGLALVLLTLPLLVARPEKYKLIEAAATLSLLIHILSPAIRSYL